MTPADPDEQRAALREGWEVAAGGWGRRADRVREWGMPVSVAMIDAVNPQPGDRVLELAAGPGDTGLMAAELIRPGGTLISSDGAEAMLEVARGRAQDAGLHNVEFRQLELEWIDLPTADVDVVLCRWGIMLVIDPAASAQEMRRILRAGGRASVAVWDVAERNPWATIPGAVMAELGHVEPAEPGAPGGMFSLGAEGQLSELLQDAGFTDVAVEAVALTRRYPAVAHYVQETTELSGLFGRRFAELDPAAQADVTSAIARALQPFTGDDGSLVVPGQSLVARARA